MMDNLHQLSEHYVEQSVDVDNVGYLLEIADKHSSYRLRRHCFEFICNSGVDSWKLIADTKAFQGLWSSAPHLVKEIDLRASQNKLVKPGELLESDNGKQELVF